MWPLLSQDLKPAVSWQSMNLFFRQRNFIGQIQTVCLYIVNYRSTLQMTTSYFGLALRWQLLILDWWRHQVKLAGAYYSCVVKWKIARQNHVSLLPLFQDESTCTIQMIIRFTRSHARFHVNQTHFHLNGFALGLVFKRRQKATRKQPITHGVICGCLRPRVV